MNYNLKDKLIVMIALSFAATMTVSRVSYAEDAAPVLDVAAQADVAGNAAEIDTSFLNDTEGEDAGVKANISVEDHMVPSIADDADDADVTDVKKPAETAASDKAQNAPAPSVDAEDDKAQNAPTPSVDAEDDEGGLLAPMAGFDDDEEDDAPAKAETKPSANVKVQETVKIEPQLDAMATPNSPFENFGNAILSKVDNDLFNQMSNIEKQTTILNLELKREELKNRVEALRAARQQARFEAEARRLAEEQKLKDMEAARKQKLIAAQEKLKQKEIELEKVKQNRMLNDYMNEMLVMNQKWIEKNGRLQNRIQELETERKELIKAIEDKLGGLEAKTVAMSETAKEAIQNHQKILAALNSQIKQLKKDILDSEMRLRDLKNSAAAAANSSANPFATAGIGNLAPTAHSVDISEEYAIMDITGKGDDIVAKIVNREGTTFTIHKGSVLKGGEVVLSITEKFIAFDSNGSKTYLYPGGSIMEYEPRATFSDAEKMQETVEKQPFQQMNAGLKNKSTGAAAEGEEEGDTNFGKAKMSSSPAHDKNNKKNNATTKKTQQKSSSGSKATKSMSFSQGMFVQ